MQTTNLERIIKVIKRIPYFKILKLAVASVLGFIVLTIITFQLAYWSRIYPGIYVCGYPVGNKTIAEALIESKKQLSLKEKDSIFLTFAEQKWDLYFKEIEFSYDLDSTLDKAYRLGRSGKPLKDLETKFKAWDSGINLGLDYQYQQNLLEEKIATIASQIFIPKIEPQLKIIADEVVIDQGKDGQELDRQRLIALLNSSLANHDFDSIELPVVKNPSVVNNEQIESGRMRAKRFLNQKLVFIYEEGRWEITPEELLNFLDLNGGFKQEKIASQVASLATVVDRQPQNALFQFENERVNQFRPAVEGLSLDQNATQELIKESLAKIEKQSPMGALADNQETIINLPVIVNQPEITVDKINNLGIKELLGRGISYYKGSVQSRIHNLALASTRLNGFLIPPGENFSFNQALGDVSQDTGYEQALIIKEGRTIPGDGGGVCQVSTTLYRAILNAGLPIIERHPHAYRVGYYEQGGFGPGLDATVWQPGVDLKFKNDTPAYILIQANVEPKTTTLTFELYGTSDGRQATVSKPKIWEQTAPPPDLYQDDPTLPTGTVKQIEKSIWGAKVSIDWLVTRNEEILQKQTIYSKYQPWQAVFLKGTGP